MRSLIHALAASTPEMIAIFGDDQHLAAALRFESARARAAAAEGLVSDTDADVIARCCDGTVDIEAIAGEASFAGTLAIPLVARLRARVAAVSPTAAAVVHRGTTSQDLADTALVLQAKEAMTLIDGEARGVCRALAVLARTHVDTPMIGRTLLQPALPIRFALKTANWLLGVHTARRRVAQEANAALALQFGGAAGTLAGFDGKALAISRRLAAMLDLREPPLSWQTRRGDLAALASALAVLTGAVAKIARDIALMAQAEVGEAFEPVQPGRGGSSAMAHKRNATGCQVALSAGLRTPGLAATILAGLPQEHERGLGGWQAEAPVIAELCGLTHGALAALAPVLEGLDVRAEAMAANLSRADVGDDPGASVELVGRALAAYEEDV